MPVDACEQVAVLVQQVETAVGVHQGAHAVEHAVRLMAGADACGSEADAVLQRADARLGVGSVGLCGVRGVLSGLRLNLRGELDIKRLIILRDGRTDLLRHPILGRILAGNLAGDPFMLHGDVAFRGKTRPVRALVGLHDTQRYRLGLLVDV